MSDEHALYIREWLNGRGRGNAFVEATVHKPSHHHWWEGGDITLKDCSRQINLDFPLTGHENRENSLAKISLLLDVLEKFQAVLLHSANKAEEYERHRDEERARKEAINAPILARATAEDDECDCASCREG